MKSNEVKPIKGNRVILNLSYRNMVLPMKDAVSILSALEYAEQIENIYSNEKVNIKPITKDDMSFSPIADETYVGIKTAQLLGISYEDYLNSLSTKSGR